MISFRLNEIPKGLSKENLTVDAEVLGIERADLGRIELQLTFNKQDENLRIECQITADATFTCDRSLDSFHTQLVSEYNVIFQYHVEDEREELSGTFRYLNPSQNVIDITKELRDTVLLSVPIKKLHPRFYRDGKVTEFKAKFGDSDNETDPRWDALTKLKQKIQRN